MLLLAAHPQRPLLRSLRVPAAVLVARCPVGDPAVGSMRLELETTTARAPETLTGVRVYLSRRNLECLLAKLDGHPPDSACTLVGPEGSEILTVIAEPNEAHYDSRGFGPGRMHPATETVIREPQSVQRIGCACPGGDACGGFMCASG